MKHGQPNRGHNVRAKLNFAHEDDVQKMAGLMLLEQ